MAPGPLGMLAATLFHGHRALAEENAEHPERTTAARYKRYWKRAYRRGALRVEVRVLHVPSGKTTTLYSSRAYRVDTYETNEMPTVLEAAEPGRDTVVFPKTRLPWASSFTWMEFVLAVKMSEDEAPAAAAAAQGGEAGGQGAGKASDRVGIEGFRLELDYYDMPAGHEDICVGRKMYRMLQTLPWTD